MMHNYGLHVGDCNCVCVCMYVCMMINTDSTLCTRVDVHSYSGQWKNMQTDFV